MGKNLNKLQVFEEFVVIKEPIELGQNCIIRSHTVVYQNNKIGKNFTTGHGVLIREENNIGDNVSIGSHSVIEHHTQIGNDVRIHSNAFIPEYSTLEDGCWIGPGVVLTNAKYPNSPQTKFNLKGVHIGKKAKIGAGAVILPGVKVGENALIGAGSVVVEDVLKNAVVAGNPARQINLVTKIKDYEKN